VRAVNAVWSAPRRNFQESFPPSVNLVNVEPSRSHGFAGFGRETRVPYIPVLDGVMRG
jgi:hypothetical protein